MQWTLILVSTIDVPAAIEFLGPKLTEACFGIAWLTLLFFVADQFMKSLET